jgi:phosphoribosyl-ATP pyrophosphohydrolase/phosphoribosyl-AMP cyclohydrolase
MTTTLPLQWDRDGLVPVVVQDHLTGDVRMVAFATREAVEKTLASGRAHFWSRSRGELWEKGQTSGNVLLVKQVLVDCDADCLVYSVEPEGPSCHTGAPSCFFQKLSSGALEQRSEQPQTLLARLEAVLEERKSSTAKSSYVKGLYEGGPARIGEKVREEAAELVRALEGESDARVAEEAADVLFHVLVGLRQRGVAWRRVLEVLAKREGVSGLSRVKPDGAT